MRTTTNAAANPFLMMMEPEAVIAAVERSERLNGLNARVCRPLDKPLIPKKRHADLQAFDAEVDAEAETEAFEESDEAI